MCLPVCGAHLRPVRQYLTISSICNQFMWILGRLRRDQKGHIEHYTHAHTSTHACTHTQTQTHHTCMNVHMHAHIPHTHAHTHIHVHKHWPHLLSLPHPSHPHLCDFGVQVVHHHVHDGSSSTTASRVLVEGVGTHWQGGTEAVHVDVTKLLQFLCKLSRQYRVRTGWKVPEGILQG